MSVFFGQDIGLQTDFSAQEVTNRGCQAIIQKVPFEFINDYDVLKTFTPFPDHVHMEATTFDGHTLFEYEFYNDHIRYRLRSTRTDITNNFLQILAQVYGDLFNDFYGYDTHPSPRFERFLLPHNTYYLRGGADWIAFAPTRRISQTHPNSPWSMLQDPYQTAATSSNLLLSPEDEAREHMRVLSSLDLEHNLYIPRVQDASNQVNTYPF